MERQTESFVGTGIKKEYELKRKLMRPLCTLLVFFSVLTMPAIGNAEEKFTDPMKYFSLPLPEGWHFLTVQVFGERQYIFSPGPLSLEQLMKGYDLDATFIFKVYALSDNKRKMTMDEILEKNIEYRTKVYGEHGIVLTTNSAGPGKAAGLKGVTANISQPDEKEFLFLGRKESRLYEVHYSYKINKEGQYLPLLKAMYQGLRLNDNRYKGGTKKFKDEKKTLSIILPTKWYMKERDDGKTAQVFISREKIVKDEDQFEVGITTIKIRRFSESFKIPIKTESAPPAEQVV